MLKKFFNKKTVIITGHRGFKGSWLSLWLSILGAKVVGLSIDTPSSPSLFNALNLKKRIIDIKVDIRNLKKINKIFNKFKPDYVFHLAAQPLVKKSYNKPLYTFTTNFLGTLNVLHILKDLKKQCTAIIITSDKSYRNFELSRGYRENDILGGDDPYSASKAAAEMMIRSYVNCFFKNKKNKKKVLIGIARAGNVIGGGDWSADRLVPDCVKFWSKKKKVIIRNPRSTRPWQFVLEVIWGYILFAIKLRKNSKLHGEVFNFGPGPGVNKNVLEVVKEMKKHWEDVDWKVSIKKEKIESALLKLNSSKAKSILKWNTLFNFKETIKAVVNWYKNFYISKKNILDFSIKQILDYQKKINLRV